MKIKNQKTTPVLPPPNGYVALSSMLVVLAVVTTIGLSVSLTSVSDLQNSFTSRQGKNNQYLVEACINEALLEINSNANLPNSITLPEGTCTTTLNSQTGENWDFDVSATNNNVSKTINIQATRNSTVTINSWQEI